MSTHNIGFKNEDLTKIIFQLSLNIIKSHLISSEIFSEIFSEMCMMQGKLQLCRKHLFLLYDFHNGED